MTDQDRKRLHDFLNTPDGAFVLRCISDVSGAERNVGTLFPDERRQAYFAGAAHVYSVFKYISDNNPEKQTNDERTY